MTAHYTTEYFSATIVVVGDFNPVIFTPDWLERNELIGAADAESARQSPQHIITRQATVYESSWFALQVLEDQFSLSSRGSISPLLKDLGASIFQLVSHTPVIAVGLNFVAHFKFANVDDYNRVGDTLAPKQIWKDVFPGETQMPGLASMRMRIQNGRRGEALLNSDEITLLVQESDKVRHGIAMQYNDHHDTTSSDGDDSRTSAERVASIIADHWDNSWREAQRVFDGLITKALVNQ